MRLFPCLLFLLLSVSIVAQKDSSKFIELKKTSKTSITSVVHAKSLNTASGIRKVGGKVEIKNQTLINGEKDDFSPIFIDNGLMFCSDSKKKKKNDKNDLEDYNLKFSTFDSLGNLTKPSSFSSRINSKYQEGPSCFSNDAKTMYLTRVGDGTGKHVDRNGTATLKIFIKSKDSLGWFGNDLFPFESNNYSYCHPTMSADGKKIFFASNMPGGFGGMDIYEIRKLPDGTWTQPINLGARVNTAKNEVFPYISENGILYFSSNGLPNNKGGLDLYKIDLDERTARASALGEPYNSEADDFGIMFMPGSDKHGFFSSNRIGGNGGDDIYSFDINE